jgi:hypothetical protein
MSLPQLTTSWEKEIPNMRPVFGDVCKSVVVDGQNAYRQTSIHMNVFRDVSDLELLVYVRKHDRGALLATTTQLNTLLTAMSEILAQVKNLHIYVKITPAWNIKDAVFDQKDVNDLLGAFRLLNCPRAKGSISSRYGSGGHTKTISVYEIALRKRLGLWNCEVELHTPDVYDGIVFEEVVKEMNK